MNIHKTTIHGKCPVNELWDYYTLRVRTPEFILAEDIEAAADTVRGRELTQEQMAEGLRNALPEHCKIQVRGRHGQNCQTTVSV